LRYVASAWDSQLHHRHAQTFSFSFPFQHFQHGT
jgi:hypothetical protein